jgi:hypothetical protein
MMLQGVILNNKELELIVQVFKSQQRANTLIEWVFVNDQGSVPREQFNNE